MSISSPLAIAVLISGNGSNLQAIIDAIANGTLHAGIKVVISNREQALGLQRAQLAGIATEVIKADTAATREEYDHLLTQCIDHYQVQLVVLAGFMRILSKDFVQHYQGRLINIHPSLLPLHPGLHTHEKALAAGDKEQGATIHFVNEEVDGGPIIIQGKCKILKEDTVETLQKKVHRIEHQIYPQVIEWYAKGRLKLEGKGVLFEDQLLPKKGKQMDFNF